MFLDQLIWEAAWADSSGGLEGNHPGGCVEEEFGEELV